MTSDDPEEQKRRVAFLEEEVTHWKANHDDVVRKKARISEMYGDALLQIRAFESFTNQVLVWCEHTGNDVLSTFDVNDQVWALIMDNLNDLNTSPDSAKEVGEVS